jgi:signal transduction histidine kinase
MIQGLLSLARLQSTATTPEATDLDAVIADRAAIWTALAAEHGVHIATTGHPAGHVRAISGAPEQIIDNLLANAPRVSPPGTTTTLATRPGPEGVELHVIDQGTGMSESERKRAFDRIWRASGAHHDSTGLGRPIVEQLTLASGGRITLEAARAGASTPSCCSARRAIPRTERTARVPHSRGPLTSAPVGPLKIGGAGRR